MYCTKEGDYIMEILELLDCTYQICDMYNLNAAAYLKKRQNVKYICKKSISSRKYFIEFSSSMELAEKLQKEILVLLERYRNLTTGSIWRFFCKQEQTDLLRMLKEISEWIQYVSQEY